MGDTAFPLLVLSTLVAAQDSESLCRMNGTSKPLVTPANSTHVLVSWQHAFVNCKVEDMKYVDIYIGNHLQRYFADAHVTELGLIRKSPALDTKSWFSWT